MIKKEVVKAVIMERQEEIKRVELTPRNVEFEPAGCYVLVGMRRAGKTYTLYEEIQRAVGRGEMEWKDVLMVNFEDERMTTIETQELGVLLEAFGELFPDRKPKVYLDEIQNVEGWEKFARRLADSKYRVMVTGSNAKMLSSEIYTTLGGRYVAREIFPFSFADFLRYRNFQPGENWQYSPTERLAVKRAFSEFFAGGGIAETFRRTDRREFLNSLYQKILLGDIVERNRLRNPRAMRLLARKLAETLSQPVSNSRLVNVLQSAGEKLSLPALKDYLEYMEGAYLTFSFTNFKTPFAERETQRKRYFFDNGVLNLFYLNEQARLLENLVAIELNRRFRPDQEEARVFYYSHGVEVDFVVPEKKLAIQVCADLSDTTTREREVKALQKFLSGEPGKGYRGLILTLDVATGAERSIDGVEVAPVDEWLLG